MSEIGDAERIPIVEMICEARTDAPHEVIVPRMRGMHLVVDHEAAREVEGRLPFFPEGLRPAHHIGWADADRPRVKAHIRRILLRPRADGARDGQSPVERHAVHLLVLAEHVQIVEIDVAALAAMLEIVRLNLRPVVLLLACPHVHLLQRGLYRLLRCRLRRCGTDGTCQAKCPCRQECGCIHLFHDTTSNAYRAPPRYRGGRGSSPPSCRRGRRVSPGDDKIPARRA